MIFILLTIGALSSFAQQQKVSVDLRNSTLQTLFKSIESQTEYRFSYRSDLVDDQPNVTLKYVNTPLSDVLNAALKSRNLTYNVVSDKSIVIMDKGSDRTKYSSNKTIKGYVYDEQGDPAIGASVRVKGTPIGVATDVDGFYTLSDVPNDAIIEISYIGTMPLDVKASDETTLAKVILKANHQTLSEVVVVGYGSQKRQNLTGAVSTISADDVNKRPVATAAGALQGADPSVNLTFSKGTLDSDYSIDIRGVASINGGTPLILCDGMEVSLNQINPNDIESISILKDASASAIYGAKASSGVILITTKNGSDQDGKVSVNYTGRMGWRQNTTSHDYIQPVTTMLIL